MLVAHEPPAAQVLPDREQALAAVVHLRHTYDREGFGPAMAMFIALTGHRGEIPADFADRPGPNPAEFGMPAADDGRRDDPLLGQNLLTCTRYEHDFDALRAASTHIVVAVGAESEGEMAHRGGSQRHRAGGRHAAAGGRREGQPYPSPGASTPDCPTPAPPRHSARPQWTSPPGTRATRPSGPDTSTLEREPDRPRRTRAPAAGVRVGSGHR